MVKGRPQAQRPLLWYLRPASCPVGVWGISDGVEPQSAVSNIQHVGGSGGGKRRTQPLPRHSTGGFALNNSMRRSPAASLGARPAPRSFPDAGDDADEVCFVVDPGPTQAAAHPDDERCVRLRA